MEDHLQRQLVLQHWLPKTQIYRPKTCDYINVTGQVSLL